MVGAHVNALLFGFHIITQEISVTDVRTLCRLDIYKGNGEGPSFSIMTSTQRSDAHLFPINAITFAPLLVLMA